MWSRYMSDKTLKLNETGLKNTIVLNNNTFILAIFFIFILFKKGLAESKI